MNFIDPELKDIFRKDSFFEDATKLDGEIYREIESRRTLRFRVGQKRYFAKVHFGVGWGEIFKNLMQLRLPILGAENELIAINKLRQLGVDTLTPVAYMSEGKNPARIRSCIVTRALENTKSLEELALEGSIGSKLRRKLVVRLADIARLMHGSGINHRDFYICHFLIETKISTEANEDPVIFLIDLHRAQVRNQTPLRWRAKDIGALLFSAIDAGIGTTDLFRFMRIYSGKSIRLTLVQDRDFWKVVRRRARKLYRRDHGHESEALRVLG